MNLAALVYALAASAVGWAVLLTLGKGILLADDRNRYLIAWFILTALMFSMPSGTAFLFVVPLFLLGLRASGADGVASSVFLVAAVPPGIVSVYGLPFGINYLLDFSFAFFLSVFFLLPAAVKAGGAMPGGRGTDAAAFAFIGLIAILGFRDATFTTGLRVTTLAVLTALVPYLAMSRAVRDPRHLRRVVGSLLACLVVASMIGFIASVVGWGIYDVVLKDIFGQSIFGYTYRAGMLRTGGTLGAAPISFGVLMMIGAFLAAALSGDMKSRWHVTGVIVCLMLGLIASVSRGPMVGTVAGLIAFQLVKPNPVPALVKSAIVAVALAPLALLTETGRALAAIIPFIGEGAEEGTVDYREQLAIAGWKVIQRYPLFGTPDYRQQPEMQAMVQGQGLVDMVNSYLVRTLEFGLIGGTFFALMQILPVVATFRAARRLAPGRPDRLREIGGGLFAAQLSFALTIATTSMSGILPLLTYMLPGLCIAYVRVATAETAKARLGVGADPETEAGVLAPSPPATAPAPAALPVPSPMPTPTPAAAPARSSIGGQGWPDDMAPIDMLGSHRS